MQFLLLLLLCSVDCSEENFQIDLESLKEQQAATGARHLLLCYMRGKLPDMDGILHFCRWGYHPDSGLYAHSHWSPLMSMKMGKHKEGTMQSQGARHNPGRRLRPCARFKVAGKSTWQPRTPWMLQHPDQQAHQQVGKVDTKLEIVYVQW